MSGVAYLGQYGRSMVVVSSIEVHSSNAAIALANAVDGLEAASAAETESARIEGVNEASAALNVAYATLSEPLDAAGDAMPAQPRETIQALRNEAADLRARINGEWDQTAMAQETDNARNLFRSVSVFALQTHEGAETSVNQLYDAIGWYLVICGVIVVAGVCTSLIGARLIIRNTVSSVRAITRAMKALANGDANVAIPGRTRRDELGRPVSPPHFSRDNAEAQPASDKPMSA
ncbi:MAG: HAMP domain-containing protein [Pseudomonadota bacterium]